MRLSRFHCKRDLWCLDTAQIATTGNSNAADGLIGRIANGDFRHQLDVFIDFSQVDVIRHRDCVTRVLPVDPDYLNGNQNQPDQYYNSAAGGHSSAVGKNT